MNTLQNILNEYAVNPNNGELAYKLAEAYRDNGAKAAACNYYMIALENSSDKHIQVESLLWMAFNYYNQYDRYGEMGLMADYARSIDPTDIRPLILKCIIAIENQYWIDLLNYSYTAINLEFKKSNLTEYYIDKYVPHIYYSIALLKLGRLESFDLLNQIISNTENIYVRNQAMQIIDGNGSRSKLLSFDKLDKDKLRFITDFDIDHNYSQIYQDLFVIGISNKLNGTYLEIGASDPYLHNNTALLEEFNWNGLSIEVNRSEVDKFNTERRNKCIEANALDIDYIELIDRYFPNKHVDYLQIDIDPAEGNLEILKKLLNAGLTFDILTFEHDFYKGNQKVRDESRQLLKDYYRIASDVSMAGVDSFEDWYVSEKYKNKVSEFTQLSYPLPVREFIYRE